jgi:hypothetical protein
VCSNSTTKGKTRQKKNNKQKKTQQQTRLKCQESLLDCLSGLLAFLDFQKNNPKTNSSYKTEKEGRAVSINYY